MTNQLVQSITDAEKQASQIKEDAARCAQEIVASAEGVAAEKAKTSAALCKAYQDSQLNAAEAAAQKEYEKEIKNHQDKAEQFVSKVLTESDVVSEIVRRIVDGNR